MEKLLAGLILIFGMAFMIFLVAALFAVVTMYAWDHSIAQVTSLPQLSLLQAFWLNVLGGMLFKSSKPSKG